MIQPYVPPEKLAVIDDDIIHARMLEALPEDIDKTDCGFAHDFTRPSAIEQAEMMILINDTMQIFFPEWSYGGYLEKLAEGVGLTRRQATRATATLSITGVAGTVIPVGFVFCTPKTAISNNLEYETVQSVTLDSDGVATVEVVSKLLGPEGNAPANSITLMASPIVGISTINNYQPATGGTEEEDDDSLRERIKERDRNNEASFVGNDNDYKRWAKEVDGVGSAFVIPEWQGAGTGTVKLIVLDANGAPANATIQNAVYEHIISPSDRDSRLAPIGAILTVTTATPKNLTIAATVTLEEDAELTEVTAAYQQRLLSYFDEAKAEGSVRYTRIGSVLSETPGILDYSNLLMNGATNNIAITVDDYPTVTALTLQEA